MHYAKEDVNELKYSPDGCATPESIMHAPVLPNPTYGPQASSRPHAASLARRCKLAAGSHDQSIDIFDVTRGCVRFTASRRASYPS